MFYIRGKRGFAEPEVRTGGFFFGFLQLEFNGSWIFWFTLSPLHMIDLYGWWVDHLDWESGIGYVSCFSFLGWGEGGHER